MSIFNINVISLGSVSYPFAVNICFVRLMDLPIEKLLGERSIFRKILICSSFKVVLYSFREEYLYCPTNEVQSLHSFNLFCQRYREPADIFPIILNNAS